MIFTSIYGVVDGIFVSNFVGNSAFAGLNLIFPVTMAIGSIGFMFGTGGSALVSKTLGEGNNKKAKEYFSLIIYSLIVIGIVVSIGLFFLIEPITNLMASFSNETSQEMINEAIKYGRIIAIGETFFMLQNVFQNFFVVNEKPHLSFIVTLICGLANIAFDALFIIVFNASFKLYLRSSRGMIEAQAGIRRRKGHQDGHGTGEEPHQQPPFLPRRERQDSGRSMLRTGTILWRTGSPAVASGCVCPCHLLAGHHPPAVSAHLDCGSRGPHSGRETAHEGNGGEQHQPERTDH